MTAYFLADLLMGVCYLIGVLCALCAFHAILAAAFRFADRDVEQRVARALDVHDPATWERAVEQARREGQS